MAGVTTGNLTATGGGTAAAVKGDFNVTVSGTFVGTAQLERSFDAGTTWYPITAAGVQLGIWTAPASEIFSEPEYEVLYRIRCTAFTSGTISYRISQ